MSDALTVVVADCDDAAALALARTLRRQGAQVIGVTARAGGPVAHSRDWSRVLVVPDLYRGPDDAAVRDALLQAAAAAPGICVLFLTRDDLVHACSRERAALGQRFELVQPDPGVLQLLLDKSAFYRWAGEQGLPVPATGPAEPARLRASLARGQGPLLVKPFLRDACWDAASPGVKAYLLDRPDDVDRVPPQVWSLAQPLLVQSFIAGPDRSVVFCLVAYGRDHSLLAWQTGRKLLQWPLRTGSTAICQTTQDGELLDLTRTVFERLRFTGLGSLEAKRDAATGQLVIVEPTAGRLDLQSEIAELGGQRLMLRAARDAARSAPLALQHGTRRACLVVEPLAVRALLAPRPHDPVGRQLAGAVLNGRGLHGAYLRAADAPVLGAAARLAAGRLLCGPRRTPTGRTLPGGRVAPGERPSASVVVCTYTADRQQDLLAALESLARQTVAPLEILVVVDHCPGLETWARGQGVHQVLASTGPPGLSGARNTGIAHAHGDVVVFLDDDAWAEPSWLAELLDPYTDPDVMGVGGAIEPDWQVARPGWLPDAFDWVVGCSYDRAGPALRQVRNPIGANMSFRRDVLAGTGGFAHELGRQGAGLAGCEETELSLRAAARFPDRRILVTQAARVHHRVPAARTTLRYFLGRCRAEGASKAAVARLHGRGKALSVERSYVLRDLPRSLVAALGGPHAGDTAGQVCATVLGVAAAAVGYGQNRLQHGRAPA